MSEQVVRAIGEGLQDIASREGIDLGRVNRCLLVGNTAMLALLTGRNYELLVRPETWMGRIDCLPGDTGPGRPRGGSLPGQPQKSSPLPGVLSAPISSPGYLRQNSRSSRNPVSFIDFGTNTEIALWDGSALFVTSAAGGPAFEGSGIRCGSPAEPGAICHVRFEDGIAGVPDDRG
jgi:hypothetical protein